MTYQRLCQFANVSLLPDPTDRYKLDERIGEGTYGEVFRAVDLHTGELVAVKILENVVESIEEIEEEYIILKEISCHPNLPQFFGLYLKKGQTCENDQLWLVMELCAGGSTIELVRNLRNRGEYLTEMQIIYIIYNTLQAVAYLHSQHCMHRDIKGHNILLTDEADVKLIDFGVSSRLGATMGRRSTSVGTPYWMAPEVIACEQQLECSYDSRCDVWSLGITVIELARGEPPLSDIHPMRALFQIPRNPPPKLDRTDCPWLKQFVAECLVKDFESRPTAEKLLNHPVMRKGAQHAYKVRKELKEIIQKYKSLPKGRITPDVTTKHGKLKVNRKTKLTRIYVDDLASSNSLSVDIIMEQLQHRFEGDRIYTFIGDILLAINPFTNIGLYSSVEHRRYSNKIRSDNPPHIFAIADAAYQSLVHQQLNQAIVISGESGAGKTESANLLLKHLVYLGKAVSKNLEERILKVNQLMEAFGNAQTGINNNSSRFGKYLELNINTSGRISGARVYVYLLEHSRIVQQAYEESNFHVFYYLYDGLTSKNWHLEYHLDNELRHQHKYMTADKQDPETRQGNIMKFDQMNKAFQLIGFKNEQIEDVYKILASILHLGDVEFSEVISDDNTDNKSKIIDFAPLHRASHLLGLNRLNVLECLTNNYVTMRGEVITRHNSVTEAYVVRDAIAKILYCKLFDWLVNCINNLLTCQIKQEYLTVGILDIFGFENFAKNSFEQLCINIANEQIQYYFNKHIFTLEQQEYTGEGIPVESIEFVDNKVVLDMFLSKPMGLLALLDEESRFPRATDNSLIEKFHTNIRSKLYLRPKLSTTQFGIQHFAGRVTYSVEGFLDKNRQYLPVEVIKLLCVSTNNTVRHMFQYSVDRNRNSFCSIPLTVQDSRPDICNKQDIQRAIDKSPKTRSQQTATSYFRYSLSELLQKMSAGSPQFVRCIKPNDTKTPRLFDAAKVFRQLRYTGVLETIRIRQHGFSHRIPFTNFLKQYAFLVYSFEDRLSSTREGCRQVLMRLKVDGWALGKTKVFLKYYHIDYLTKLYDEKMKKIILAQACVRRFLHRRRYLRMKREMTFSVLTIQKYIRGWAVRKNTQELKNIKKRDEQIPTNEDNQKIDRLKAGKEVLYIKKTDDINLFNEENCNVKNKKNKNILSNNDKIIQKHNNTPVIEDDKNFCILKRKLVNVKPFAMFDSPKPYVQRGLVQEVTKKFAEEPLNEVQKTAAKRMMTLDVDSKQERISNPLHQSPPFWNFQPGRLRILGANNPSNFRNLLRPIHNPPTESLRKRVLERCQKT